MPYLCTRIDMAFSFYYQIHYANNVKAHNADMGNVHIGNDNI